MPAAVRLLSVAAIIGGETHDLTDLNVVDHELQLAWSGSIGFAAGAPPRSDHHAGILANKEPWQQNKRLVHENVTAIITAWVHACQFDVNEDKT